MLNLCARDSAFFSFFGSALDESKLVARSNSGCENCEYMFEGRIICNVVLMMFIESFIVVLMMLKLRAATKEIGLEFSSFRRTRFDFDVGCVWGVLCLVFVLL